MTTRQEPTWSDVHVWADPSGWDVSVADPRGNHRLIERRQKKKSDIAPAHALTMLHVADALRFIAREMKREGFDTSNHSVWVITNNTKAIQVFRREVTDFLSAPALKTFEKNAMAFRSVAITKGAK